MTRFRVLASRIRALFAAKQLDRELEDELRSHLEMETEANIRRGMPPEEARYAALSHGEYRRQWVEPRFTAFVCGMGVMILGLVIMGCPARLLLRAAYGDPLGAVGIVAVLAGVVAATLVMRGRAG